MLLDISPCLIELEGGSLRSHSQRSARFSPRFRIVVAVRSSSILFQRALQELPRTKTIFRSLPLPWRSIWRIIRCRIPSHGLVNVGLSSSSFKPFARAFISHHVLSPRITASPLPAA